MEQIQVTTQSIPGLVKQISIPASIGYFFQTMYNVVDTYFGGTISTQALASLSLSLPVFFIIIAVGTGISTGATALIGNALGSLKSDEARLFGLQGITFGIFVSIALTFAGIYISPWLFSLLGASGEYLAMAETYMNTIFYGTLPFILLYMLNAILNALGNTKPYRNFLVIGFLLNIVLDPWFIRGGLGLPAMGLVGVAMATVIIQIVGCFYVGWEVHKTGIVIDTRLNDFVPKARHFKEIARQGFPASVNMLTVGMGIFVITYFVSHFGKEAVAAYGIAMRVEQIVLVPTIGLNIATLTLVAQNNGAGLFDRVKGSVRTALRYGGIIMAMGTVGVFSLAGPLMRVFSHEQTVIGIGITYLRIDALVLYAYVILFVNVAAMQGIKNPMFAVWIGICRQIIAPVIVFWTLTRILDFGLLGIWWGIFSITWGAALFSIFYVRAKFKEAGSYPPGTG